MHDNVATHMYVTLLSELSRLEALGWNALTQVTNDEAFAFSLGAESNSISVLVRHLAGHMRSRFTDFLLTDGEKPWRDRRREFDASVPMTRSEVMAEWRDGWRCVFDALRPLTWRDMERTITIRGEPCTVFDALARQVAHCGLHVGQIVMLSKHLAGNHWTALSPPPDVAETGRFEFRMFGFR